MTQSVGDLGVLAADFEHKAPRRAQVAQDDPHLQRPCGIDAFLAAVGMPRLVASIRREHVEAYIVDVGERWRE
jgi:hypothetical protein